MIVRIAKVNNQQNERNCSVKWKCDAAQGTVVKAKKAQIDPNLGRVGWSFGSRTR